LGIIGGIVMVTHPKENILPKPSPFSSYESNKVEMKDEKTIIPRAEDVRAAKASGIMKFKFINHMLYLLASFETKREINYAVRHGESYIFILDDDWRICYFPELIDRLKYLGYRVNKNIFGSYYVYWEDECPGEEI
jgi:hypothetical protein